ncbi:MAG: NAD(P)-dependent alcohol dehydrogenase [Limnobacter sp.]|nr:NAD(P)-dependent alcohol dehydrogenase [Limnobacter sp.]
MKVFQVEGDWTMDNVRLATRPDPTPGRGQVRVAMRAAALNYRDLLVPLRGYGQRMKALPLIMLSDGAGVVDAVGPEVTRFRVGDRVCPMFFQRWSSGAPDPQKFALSLGSETDGTMAEYMVLSEDGVAPVPEHMSDVEAATLSTAALTAWRALVSEGRIKAGDCVLVQGTGGVALFAIQIAKLLGARVIATSSSDEKLERVRSLGADETINYVANPEWGRRARELSGGDGVDHVVELGGEGTLPQSLRAVRTGGTISMIGVLSGGTMNASLGQVVTRHVRLQGITVGNRDDFEAMSRAMAQHALRPCIDREFAFEDLVAALDYLRSGRHFGKIAIRF